MDSKEVRAYERGRALRRKGKTRPKRSRSPHRRHVGNSFQVTQYYCPLANRIWRKLAIKHAIEVGLNDNSHASSSS